MNPMHDKPMSSSADPAPASFDETLHLITHPPVPTGLKERVHAALMEAGAHTAAPRRARILMWPAALAPSAFWAGNGWVRAAAAAAIVFVVAGGGWGVYQRVERPTAKVIVMPVAQPAASGAFSSAGAIRTPQTVNGPVVMQPVTKTTSKKQARRKAPVRPVAQAPNVIAVPVSAAAGSK
jgi:hypothetical protein